MYLIIVIMSIECVAENATLRYAVNYETPSTKHNALGTQRSPVVYYAHIPQKMLWRNEKRSWYA